MKSVKFTFDASKCSGCQACTMACFDQNDIDITCQTPFRQVLVQENWNQRGDRNTLYRSVSCLHCNDAACMKVCPKQCFYKDAKTGLILYHNEVCIGCKACATACPVHAPTFDQEGKMVKCDGCVERLKVGLEPACVRVCPSGALHCMD